MRLKNGLKKEIKYPPDSRVLLTTGIYYYWKRDYETSNEYLSKINPQTWAKTLFSGLNNIANQYCPV